MKFGLVSYKYCNIYIIIYVLSIYIYIMLYIVYIYIYIHIFLYLWGSIDRGANQSLFANLLYFFYDL